MISDFKESDEPEILIVVNKLLTGFDAPRNTVLYLCKKLEGHNLLQAVARVNRVYEGKEFGYIVDYEGLFENLTKALATYDALAGFDDDDLAGTLISVNEEISKLKQRHSDLWGIFKSVGNLKDRERIESHLRDESIRHRFYDYLSQYSRTLALALSTEVFYTDTPKEQIREYESDLKAFMKLRKSVQLRYSEKVDFRQFEGKIQKLLDTHIHAHEVAQLNDPVNIFDEKAVELVIGESSYGDAYKADIIAHKLKRTISEKEQDDPVFYKKFSKRIEEVIRNFKNHLLSDAQYLMTIQGMKEEVINKKRDDVPKQIADDREACAYYGTVKELFTEKFSKSNVDEGILCEMVIVAKEALDRENRIDFWSNQTAINSVKDALDDYFFDVLKDKHHIELTDEQMSEITTSVLEIAKHRRQS